MYNKCVDSVATLNSTEVSESLTKMEEHQKAPLRACLISRFEELGVLDIIPRNMSSAYIRRLKWGIPVVYSHN